MTFEATATVLAFLLTLASAALGALFKRSVDRREMLAAERVWSQAERDDVVARAENSSMVVAWKEPTIVELERECFSPIEDVIAEAERRVEQEWAL